MTDAAAKMPPFESVLKSRDVEDPVNLWLHRPLAYAFVRLVFSTPITPNQVTFLSMLVGLCAVPCLLLGTPQSLILGGILIWTSAILDGADGILARAKRMSSEVGRALDGVADLVVAVPVMLAAAFHIWMSRKWWVDMAVVPLAFGTSLFHVYLYDYYKESYMMLTKGSWDGRMERVPDVRERLARLKREKAGFVAIAVTTLYLGMIENQRRVVRSTNPAGLRDGLALRMGEQSAADFRQLNRGPIKLWRWISLAPHSYLISLAAMFDQLHVYLWARVVLANALFLIVLVWQRARSEQTLQRWRASGALAPAASG